MFFFRRSSKRPKPVILPRNQHCISRKNIAPEALRVLYRLADLNYEAYLVGGSVRDLLLGRTPKDFDVGTDARPNEIKRKFSAKYDDDGRTRRRGERLHCFLVGKRFRLAHVVFGKKVIETATFRKAPDPNAVPDEHGLYQYEDNNYGTPEEDAYRRDFTVNGLFYDIRTFSIIDYVGGLKDLEAKTIRSIGNPATRFQEDPVRMMRAVRFAAKLGFTISPEDEKAIRRYAGELSKASVSRLCEEIQRLFVRGATERSLALAYDYGLLKILLPELHAWLAQSSAHQAAVWASLRALDAVSVHHETTAATALAMLYRPMVLERVAEKLKRQQGRRGPKERALLRLTSEAVLNEIAQHYHLPRAVWMTARDIIELVGDFTSPPEGTRAGDVRFATHGIFPEVLLAAEVMAQLEPEKGWEVEAWRAFARRVERTPEGEGDDEVPNARPNPHRRQRRRRRSRHRNAASRTPAAGPASEQEP